MRRVALVLVALALSGCETTAQKSAKLEREALHAGGGSRAAKGLTITHASTALKVVNSTLIRDSEGAAAVITVRNLTDRAHANIPLAVAVHDPRGSLLYSNATAGLARSLTAVPLIQAHGELTWIDDQVTGAPAAGSVAAELGEGDVVSHAVPQLAVEGVQRFEEAGSGYGAKGTVVNNSGVAQHELVVYATARRGASVVAAGRAVLSEVPGRGSAPFQVFFIGDPQGARLQVSAPPSTLH